MAVEENVKMSPELVKIMSTILSRAQLASKLGQQYGGDRDVYQALGYKDNPDYNDYSSRYTRQDIAKALVNRPIDGTWRGGFLVIEPEKEKDEPTEFEKDWKELEIDLKLTTMFKRVDKLTSLGKYGVLFLGFDDVKNSTDFKKPVERGDDRKLLYVKPLSESNAKVKTWENDTTNPRYSLPRIYEITVLSVAELDQTGSTTRTQTVEVHWTRIIHIAQDKMESEVIGTPQLEVGLNRLFDLEKLVGGSAEMFWRGARPGYQAKVDEDYEVTDETDDTLQDQMDEYENNLRRILTVAGVDIKELAMQISDPKGHVDVQIEMLSAAYGIPKRILTGSERGELASTSDRDAWFEKLQERRTSFAEPEIIRETINRCLEFGVLSSLKEEEGDYVIEWSDLWSESDKERAEVGKTRSESLSNYSKDPLAQSVVPPNAFLHYFLGLSEDQIAAITEEMEAAQAEEDADFEEENLGDLEDE